MKSHANEDDLDVRQSKQIKQIYILIVTDKKAKCIRFIDKWKYQINNGKNLDIMCFG